MTTEQIIRDAVFAYASQDIDRVLACLTDDIVYTIEASEPLGPYRANCADKEGFVQVIGQIVGDYVVEKFELADILVDGDRAATRIDVTLRNRITGTLVVGQNAIFWTVRDGLVSEVREFHDTAQLAAGRG